MAAKTEASLDVGRRLRELREERGIPKELVALTLGMSAENLRHYESGRNQLAVTQLPALANLFKMTAAELVSDLFVGRATSNTGGQSATKSDDRITANYIYTDGRRMDARVTEFVEYVGAHGLVLQSIAAARPLSHAVAHTG